MDQLTPQNIVSMMLIGGVLWIAIQGFCSWCRRVDSRIYDPLRDGPVDHGNGAEEDDWEGLNLCGPVPPTTAAQHLPASLRRPLPASRNMEGAAQAGERRI